MKRKRGAILLALGAAGLAGVGLFYILARQGIGIGCPFFKLTGLRCPGCGNSRVALALLEGDLFRAFKMNMLFPLEFGYLAWIIGKGCAAYWHTGRFSYWPKRWWIDAGVLALVVIWGIVRNFLGM